MFCICHLHEALLPNTPEVRLKMNDKKPKKFQFYFSRVLEVRFWKWLMQYRGSPDSTVFAPPGNRTIVKTVLFGDWFSTKIVIYDFWIFKVPFFGSFSKLFWFLKVKKWLLGSFWNIYWVIYHKFWHPDKILGNF